MAVQGQTQLRKHDHRYKKKQMTITLEVNTNEGTGWPHSHWPSCAACRQFWTWILKLVQIWERNKSRYSKEEQQEIYLQMEHIWLKITVTAKTLKKYKLSSTILRTKLLLGQGCSSKVHCEKKNPWAKRVYPVLRLSHKTTNQFVIFLRSWQLGGECPHDNVPPLLWTKSFMVPLQSPN